MGRDSVLIAANDNLPEEIWKTVPSKPNIEASSHGRVRRLPHVGTMPHGGPRLYKSEPTFGAIRSASKDARHLFFGVSYRGIGNIKIHFAVCEAFHGPPPIGKRRVRHLNENGLDNRPENLVWDRQRVNMNDPTLKRYQTRRINPVLETNLSKVEKRAGIYDNIKDLAIRYSAKRALLAANDNSSVSDIDKFVKMNEARLSNRVVAASTQKRHPHVPVSRNVQRDLDVLARHNAGEKHPSIAKSYGISREMVRKIVISQGGSPRRSKC
ncbi:HNH endonuclease [Rhizobium laguerreae]|uniref:HNH endonuclease n=1 Tax=Rhizobium laguerreae TaxID=1076926 RepID=UPI001C910858|nr:HNH endonuclease [Rhizobium laguerreae]MBY3434850.1 hypothetical protein [Rhizobium laguerreae]MBY3448993.1 hypothetical protein [Rhizobium laguerreae]MBY3456767.1 hypothetical protein [Rhizobium laguerreae]